MSFTIPTVDQFKAQFFRGFPYAVPAWGATASCTIDDTGIINTVSLLTAGQGYTVPPTVTVTPQPNDITGGDGVISASVSGGSVTGLVITDGGSSYMLPPSLTFSNGAGDDTATDEVQDEDIQGAILDAQFNINPGLFGTQQMFTRAFLYLTAHQLIEKLLMDAEGTQSQYEWLTAAKSVSDASQSFQFPERILVDPYLANVARTKYGAMYIQIISPQLIGNVITPFRWTMP